MVIVPKKIPRRNRRKRSPAQIRKLLRKRQRKILNRIANHPGPERDQPMITATNIHYELGERVQGIAAGGIGAMLLLAQRTGLIRDIDHNLHVLKRHLPYHESDHVLNIAFRLIPGRIVAEDRAYRELRAATTKSFSTPWVPSAFPTLPPKATSAAVSTKSTFTP